MKVNQNAYRCQKYQNFHHKVHSTPPAAVSLFTMWFSQLFNFATVLDEVGSKEEAPAGESTLKTRSLPAWVRSKPRPLSTEDDLNDLYAKVSDCGGFNLRYMV